MPFTFSHPIAAVPFARCGLPISALVVGSLTPDFPYFLQLSTGSQFGHSFRGLLLFCVPAGLIALWLLHRVLERPVRSLLPISTPRKPRCESRMFSFWPLKQTVCVLCALLIGAITHLVWDSFTHANGFFVRHWSLLREPIFATSHGTIYVFKFLQHISSLLGAIALWRLYRRETRGENAAIFKRRGGANPLYTMFFFAAMCALLWTFAKSSGSALQSQARDFVVALVSTIFIELLTWSIWWHRKQGAQTQP